jgi:predicted nucleic acid-binding protein
MSLIPFDEGAAERHAGIRSSGGVAPADAIQLACAAEARVDVFVTDDRRLTGKKSRASISIVGLDRKLL